MCLKIQHDEKVSTGDTWLSDDYIRGLMYDTAAAGACFRRHYVYH